MNNQTKTIFAWVFTNRDGTDDFFAYTGGRENFGGLIYHDPARAESYREHAILIEKMTGCPARLVCYQAQ